MEPFINWEGKSLRNTELKFICRFETVISDDGWNELEKNLSDFILFERVLSPFFLLWLLTLIILKSWEKGVRGFRIPFSLTLIYLMEE